MTVFLTPTIVHPLKLLFTRTIYQSTKAGGGGAQAILIRFRARLSVFRTQSSALYRMDAVVTLHTSDKYSNTT